VAAERLHSHFASLGYCTLQATQRCYEPQPVASSAQGRARSFQPRDLLAQTRRTLPPEDRPPELWSQAESMYRTGVHCTAKPFVQGALGGARREYPLFAQDGERRREPTDCSKNQYAQGALSPGVLVRFMCLCMCAHWQLHCQVLRGSLCIA